jgi:hypothetical protein
MPYGNKESYDILAEMVDVDPDVLRRLAEMELLDKDIAMQMIQGERGQSLSATPMPQATVAGGATVAPHPLQFAAAGIQQGMGNMQQMQSQQAIEALRRRQRQQVYGPGPTMAGTFGGAGGY